MSLHCTSPWRGSQSRISFSIGNLYWRQMNQDAKGDQHQDRSRGPGAKTLSLRPQKTHASPGPGNKHILSTNWASQSQGNDTPSSTISYHYTAPETRRSKPRRLVNPAEAGNRSILASRRLITLAAFTPGLLAANGRKKMLFFFLIPFFFGQSAFVFKHIR